MSILIKGMEIPKSCGECLDIGWHYVFDCRLDDAEEGERLPNCPLVPVPPHGRLKDADALIKSLSLDESDVENGASLLMAIFLEVLKAAPTIIEAEGKGTMTNADRIRAMSDEELAKFIAGQRAFYCTFEDPSDKDYPKMLDWLKQGVSE